MESIITCKSKAFSARIAVPIAELRAVKKVATNMLAQDLMKRLPFRVKAALNALASQNFLTAQRASFHSILKLTKIMPTTNMRYWLIAWDSPAPVLAQSQWIINR
jgi:hypothetical protein